MNKLNKLMLPDCRSARWAEIRIRYQSATSRSSVTWTAASIVLCIGHSEAC